MNNISVNKRSVVFLDVLGFKNIIDHTPLHELASKYEYMITSSEKMNRPYLSNETTPRLFPDHQKNKPWCKRYIFSDSIILISLGDDPVSFLKLIVYARKLLQSLLAMRLPARGGIAFGELHENSGLNVVLGKALTRAYELERKQQWIGVAIEKELEQIFPEVFSLIIKPDSGIAKDIFLRYPVPFKDGSTKLLHTLNWRFNLIVEKGTRSLFNKTDDKEVQTKIENTLEYARTIVKSGRIYVHDQDTLPIELRSFYVGSKEPPFPHGDEL